MSLLTLLFAQAESGASQCQPQGGFLVLLPMYLIIFFVFYFFLIRPQQKKQKDHQQMLAQLKKNDRVITAGGMLATVVNVKDQTIVLKIDDQVKVEFQKSSISTVIKS
ncbi:MAG: preprotein translocase subunit YajC [Candidatus Omnitrophota bacterium]|nr:MAG: preprotein translocase subunit YajC [Candidatus Omnitrophota bacterium]